MERQTNILERIITDHMGELNSESMARITAATMAFILKAIWSSELSVVLREHASQKVNTVAFRKDLYTGYVLKNLKLWVWFSMKNDLGPKASRKLMGEYLVHDEDFSVLKTMKSKYGKDYARRIQVMGKKYSHHTLETFNRHVDDFVDEMRNTGHIDKFARRKLAFVYRTNNIGHDGMVSDLLLSGIIGIYRQYPRIESKLHLINVGKQSLHNYGINLISHYNSKGRSRLTQLDDGTFESRLVSVDASEVNGGGSNYLVSEQEDKDVHVEVYSQASLDRELSEYKGKERAFLELMMGRYSAEFRAWADERKVGNLKDPDAFRAYLGLSEDCTDAVLGRFGERIANDAS